MISEEDEDIAEQLARRLMNGIMVNIESRPFINAVKGILAQAREDALEEAAGHLSLLGEHWAADRVRGLIKPLQEP